MPTSCVVIPPQSTDGKPESLEWAVTVDALSSGPAHSSPKGRAPNWVYTVVGTILVAALFYGFVVALIAENHRECTDARNAGDYDRIAASCS